MKIDGIENNNATVLFIVTNPKVWKNAFPTSRMTKKSEQFCAFTAIASEGIESVTHKNMLDLNVGSSSPVERHLAS